MFELINENTIIIIGDILMYHFNKQINKYKVTDIDKNNYLLTLFEINGEIIPVDDVAYFQVTKQMIIDKLEIQKT